MFDGAGWIFGGTALASIGLACWSQVRAIGRQMLARMVASFEAQFPLVQAIECYARDRFKASPFSPVCYDGAIVNVRPRSREQMIVVENQPAQGKLFWHGWRPIWMQFSNKAGEAAVLKCWYIRGTFNADQLMIDAAEHYNDVVLGADGRRRSSSRYAVNHVFGTAGKQIVQQGMNGGTAGYSSDSPAIARSNSIHDDERYRRTRRILKWSQEDIGPTLLSDGSALDRLALSEQSQAAVDEFKQWLDLERWYKSRGIPWRKNWLLYGPPGTGKSSIVQAIAEDYNLPIWVFDLATLYNDELHRNWSRMLAEVPCIALLEDLDKVFEGSANISKGDLTLDCLLNCIDGVSRANGLFLVITTNRIDSLDPALKRPGRADSILEMAAPDEAGLVKIASRILPDDLYQAELLAARHIGKSGAEFQRICEQEALSRLRSNQEALS